MPAEGERRYRVAFLGGCIANISFARLNEATVRVLQKNGCEVSIPASQGCCGALHVHAGIRDEARKLARRNIDALLEGGFDAIITNAGGCGSTLKEYGELLEHDAEYAEKARRFSALVKDVNEFLARHRTESADARAAAHGHLSGFLPSGAWPEDSLRAPEAAQVRFRDWSCGRCALGSVLRQRGNLQRSSHRHGDVAAQEEDG